MDQRQRKEQGRALSRHGVERTCIGCRAQQEGRNLLRFVCSPQGVVILDVSGHAPGRGVYVCCDVTCLRKALKPTKLCLTLKRAVLVPDFDTMYREVKKLLYKRLRTCLSLGQKAGAVVSGYALLRKAFAQARVLHLILAEDVTTGRAEEYRFWCTQYDVPYVTLFTKVELGRIIGKSSRSAVGLTVPQFIELLHASLTLLQSLETAYRSP